LGANGLLGFVRVPFLELNNPHNRVPQLYAARNDRAINTEVHQTNRSYETIAPGATFQGTLEIMLEDKLLEWNFGAYRTFWRIKINEKKEELIKNEDLDRWLKNNKAPGKQIIINDYILGCLRDIKELGGYKSKGFGKVDIHVEKIEAAQ
jgi:CRISPR/Cas system CSM-associated protein Csm3 (group 7 of RAMP superfamily)